MSLESPKGAAPTLLRSMPNRGQRHRLAQHLQSVFKVNYVKALEIVDRIGNGGGGGGEDLGTGRAYRVFSTTDDPAEHEFTLVCVDFAPVTDYTIDWGDGSPTEHITDETEEIMHTYAGPGVFTLKVYGPGIPAIAMDDMYSDAFLLEFVQWGQDTVWSMHSLWKDHYSLSYDNFFVSPNVGMPVLAAQPMSGEDCFNSADPVYAVYSRPEDPLFQTVRPTTLHDAFGSTSLTDLSFLADWDMSECTDMYNMLYSAVLATGTLDVSGWNTSKLTSIWNAFWGCDLLNFVGLSAWDVSSLTNGTAFMDGGTPPLAVTEYDALLASWAAQAVQPDVTISFGTSQYSAGAQADRDILTNAPNNWVITDGGVAP